MLEASVRVAFLEEDANRGFGTLELATVEETKTVLSPRQLVSKWYVKRRQALLRYRGLVNDGVDEAYAAATCRA